MTIKASFLTDNGNKTRLRKALKPFEKVCDSGCRYACFCNQLFAADIADRDQEPASLSGAFSTGAEESFSAVLSSRGGSLIFFSDRLKSICLSR
ncbi:MAG: hypothetical protein IKO02_05995, partial [Lentisphaeria bacterium]|nr:hypothetical protein [Lentisphaeria bacterium]